jgi:hypothetical protein
MMMVFRLQECESTTKNELMTNGHSSGETKMYFKCMFIVNTHRFAAAAEIISTYASLSMSGLPDFSCYNIQKREKYTIKSTKYTKWRNVK